MRHCTTAIACLLCAAAVSADTTSDNPVAKAKTIYTTEMEKINDTHMAKLTAWPKQYAEKLAAFQKKIQTKGDLEGWQQVDAEIKRFDKQKTLTAKHLSSYTALQTLQTAYLKHSQLLQGARSSDVLQLRDFYVNHVSWTRGRRTKISAKRLWPTRTERP